MMLLMREVKPRFVECQCAVLKIYVAAAACPGLFLALCPLTWTTYSKILSLFSLFSE
jgi:hypothetical protein